MDRNWVKNETSQNSIFPSSINAPPLGEVSNSFFLLYGWGEALECEALAFDNVVYNYFDTMLEIGSFKTMIPRRMTEHINKLGVEHV